jgi:Bacterial Ig-like domain (group 1)
MRRLSFIAALSLALLAACGGGGATLSTVGSSSGGSSGGGTSGPGVAAIAVTSSSPSILSDGSTTAVITALVTDSTNNLIAGVPVKFTATSGGLAVTLPTTDTSGAATATLSTAGDPSIRVITVTATAGGKQGTVPVNVVTGSSSTTVQMGSPAGASFVPSVIGISSTSLSAGGSASLTVALQQSDGTLYNQAATVIFSSNCAAQNLATITSPVTTSTGVATATYSAKGCSGSDVITASATIGTTSLSATGTLTVAAAAIGSIIYKSANPTIIALKGSGSTTRPESSTVVFQVLDQSGGPSPGAKVTFSLNTSVGGISVSAGPVTSDVNGNVQTTVTAGTVATPVRVTATVLNTSPTISTESNQLTVSTGIATQAEFSMAVTCTNVEALNTDGVLVAVTVRLADRFSNPVADGTSVSFNTEGGHIQSQCGTTTTASESGVCTVEWVSANPRPTVGRGRGPLTNREGRSTLFAMAIGEESFVDLNGNGAFDPGEPFTDLGERFRDDNGNGVYDVGEYFYDFNNNGTRDGPDGLFNGVLCNDPARCNPADSSTGIAASSLIIMAGGTPDGISPAGGATLATASLAAGLKTYFFNVADVNFNPMPAGTTVTASVQGQGLSVDAPTTFTYPCTTEPLTYSFSLAVSGSAVVGSTGLFTLDIKSPAGLETLVNYHVPIGP